MKGLWGRVRPALSGLTTRGRSFISAGAASALCAVVLGQEDLLRIAVLLAGLPLACAFMLSRSQHRIGLSRTADPGRVPVGDVIRVRLEMQNLSGIATRVLLAEDRVPYPLGSAPRFVLDRMPGKQQAAVTYSLRSQVRGRFAVGPLRLKVTDPFGMCELTRSFTATRSITVLPRVWPIGSVDGGGYRGGTGDSLTRSTAISGEDDASTREYREGDDLRRVHWRSTAKRGELMVRREEQPRQLRVTVLLDRRADAHRGEGAASSFEWAVSMAASVAVHFGGLQHGLRIVSDGTGSTDWTRPGNSEDLQVLMDRLAEVGLGQPEDLDQAIAQLRRTRADAMTVAVLGDLDPERARTLAAFGREGFPGVAVLIRSAGWGGAGLHAAAAPGVADQLRRGNWLVVEVQHGMTPSDAWSAMTAPGGSPVAAAAGTSA